MSQQFNRTGWRAVQRPRTHKALMAMNKRAMLAKATDKKPTILDHIKKAIRIWIDSVPSFTSSTMGNTLVCKDSVYDSALAVVVFEEDRVTINLPEASSGSGKISEHARLYTLLLGANKTTKTILYSDPELQTQIKATINSAYKTIGR